MTREQELNTACELLGITRWQLEHALQTSLGNTYPAPEVCRLYADLVELNRAVAELDMKAAVAAMPETNGYAEVAEEPAPPKKRKRRRF